MKNFLHFLMTYDVLPPEFFIKKRRTFLVISLGLYFTSLLLPAFNFHEPKRPMMGYEILSDGWVGILMLEPQWYANIFYLYGLRRLYIQKAASKSGVTAMILAASSFIVPIYYFPNEAVSFRVESMGVGAYLWFAAIMIMYGYSIERIAPDSNQPDGPRAIG